MGIDGPVRASMVLAVNDDLRLAMLRLAARPATAPPKRVPKPQPVSRVPGIGQRLDVRL